MGGRCGEESQQSTLPSSWLISLRRAMDAGLTEDQVVTVLELVAGSSDLLRRFEPDELVERSRCVLNSIARVKSVR